MNWFLWFMPSVVKAASQPAIAPRNDNEPPRSLLEWVFPHLFRGPCKD